MPVDTGGVGRGSELPVLLVTGSSGQVGFELLRELAALGTVVVPPRSELDLARPESIREVVNRVRPTVIVNAGAYTAVDKAESDRDRCFAVNATAPGVLAEAARRVGSALIHYSTDYVFDGRKTTPYVETDSVAPLNVYGESKLAGERAIAEVGGSWIVLRTSWVYGARGNNFLRTMLRLARKRDELRVVDDQTGAPTWCRSIAAATAQLLARAGGADRISEHIAQAAGVYHLSSSGQTSWAGFARAILSRDPRAAEQRCTQVVGIPTSEYPTPAARPAWSVLDNSRISARFGLHIPPWESELDRAMREDFGASMTNGITDEADGADAADTA